MKVFLIAKDASGEVALRKVTDMWKGRHRFRMMRIMGNRVSFQAISEDPFTLQYFQVDFNTLPLMEEYTRRVKLSVYAHLESYGVKTENVEVEFK